jgi:uncharacterized protein with PQ loop repeat
MMEAALRWIGVFFVADFLTVVVLAALVQIISGRGANRARLTCMFGMVFFFGVCLGLIYGGLWLMIQFAK